MTYFGHLLFLSVLPAVVQTTVNDVMGASRGGMLEGSVLNFVWKKLGKPRWASGMQSGAPSSVQTKSLPNTRLESYRYFVLIGRTDFMVRLGSHLIVLSEINTQMLEI